MAEVQSPGNTKYQPETVRRSQMQKVKGLADQIDPNINPLAKTQVSGPGSWEKQNEELQKLTSEVDRITPKPIEGEARAKLEARGKQLENVMKYGSSKYQIPDMPSKMEMKNNPDDSTRRHMSWEKAWKFKTVDDEGNLADPGVHGYGAVMEWKDIQYRLHAEADAQGHAPGIGNIDNFRPDVKGVPLAKDHTARAFSLAGNLGKDKFDKMFPDHEPLASEIQAGTYFAKCAGKTDDGFCGEDVIDKKVPYCVTHMEQFV